jgi:Zn-dependent peptidase ImmA (M78 family)
MYYKMQKFSLPRKAKFCKCSINHLPYINDDEEIMERQAIGIAPRILMPKDAFIEVAGNYNIVSEEVSWREIADIARFFDVSKQSVTIRLQECGIL